MDRAAQVAEQLDRLAGQIAAIRPMVDAHVTRERLERYLVALAEQPAPSTAATALRGPVLHRLLAADGAFDDGRLGFAPNFQNSASTVLLTGTGTTARPLWYVAHLDTISYLVLPYDGGRHPLVPFCYHLTTDGSRAAVAYRYDLRAATHRIVAQGQLVSVDGLPSFRADDPAIRLGAGDRVVPVARCRPRPDGHWTGHFDNAGGVAALAVAAPVLARAGIPALLAFPDEEEGPHGAGSQVMGRGGARIIDRLPAPDLAIVVDMQQAGGDRDDDAAPMLPENTTRLGQGAVLSEFSSLARGAVTPQPLYALARHLTELLAPLGVAIQESNNAYTSRSDDVSVLLKTPNILLLGFPGFDRHFDKGPPRADPADLVDLAKALVYAALLRPVLAALRPMP